MTRKTQSETKTPKAKKCLIEYVKLNEKLVVDHTSNKLSVHIPAKLIISGNSTKLIQVGIAFHIDDTHALGLVIGAPEESNKTIRIRPTIIDSSSNGRDYTFSLANHGNYPITLGAGEHIADIIFVKSNNVTITEVDKLPETDTEN